MKTTAEDVRIWEKVLTQRILDTLDEVGEASTKALSEHPNLVGLTEPKPLRQRLYAMYLVGALAKPRRGGSGAGSGHGLVWRRA